MERMMTTTTRSAPATEQHLFTVVRHWRDLSAALTTRGQTWPPTMGIATLSRRDQDEEQAEAARHRAAALRALERSADRPGWTAAPLRLGILDTMTTVQDALLALTDQIAAEIQFAPVTPAPPRRSWPDDPRARQTAAADDARRNELALRQSRDPRRWRYASADRTVPRAGLWLLARVQGVRGPWRPLNDEQHTRVSTVARACARLVEHALDVGDGHIRLATACPGCGGLLDLHGGAGAKPVVRCTACGRTWTSN
jgi:hypothetical protein